MYELSETQNNLNKFIMCSIKSTKKLIKNRFKYQRYLPVCKRQTNCKLINFQASGSRNQKAGFMTQSDRHAHVAMQKHNKDKISHVTL